MPWSPSLPDIEEARLDAIKALLIASLTDLNAVLQRDNLWPATVPITSAMVTIGHPTRWPEAEPPLLLCVCPGENEVDVRTKRLYDEISNTQGFSNEIVTNIYAFVYPRSIQVPDDVLAEEQARTRLQARLSGWLRAGVFNRKENQTIPLTSQEFHTGTQYDFLDRCVATESYKGDFDSDFGTDLVFHGVHVVHESFVA